MKPDWILEKITDHLYDEICGFEGASDTITKAAESPDVIAAFAEARALFGSKLGRFRMADKLLRTLKVTFDEHGQPLLDGAPMYVKREEQS